jgi:hypothetical protein
MENLKDFVDDKTVVILCVTLLGLCAFFSMSDPEALITQIVTGLFGVAVGRGMK